MMADPTIGAESLNCVEARVSLVASLYLLTRFKVIATVVRFDPRSGSRTVGG
jgi:hypothetical protein